MSHGPPFQVLFEDNHLLAVVKPPTLPTMGAATGQTSLVDLVRRYLKHKYKKPGNVFLGIVSRLDAPVTGVVLLARTSKAAARLTDQFRRRDVEKVYWALVDGDLSPAEGTWCDWLRKDERSRRMRVAAAGAEQVRRAELRYRVLRPIPRGSFVEVELVTGRKHQIRVQMSHHGHPVFGDTKYGSRQRFPVGIALLARRLRFLHPVRREMIELVAPVPRHWWGFGVSQNEFEDS
jgi:23S rRNA pseudouridine1911/1915/1917 synthase